MSLIPLGAILLLARGHASIVTDIGIALWRGRDSEALKRDLLRKEEGAQPAECRVLLDSSALAEKAKGTHPQADA